MKKLVILFIFILFLGGVFALCEEGQIDINSASVEELDEIIHVGPAVAGYIIEERPFNSLDDLVNVNYISSGYLEDIINQGLACVDEETQEEVEKETPEEPEETEEENNEISEVIEDFKEESNIKKPITLDTISLNPKNPKDIKSSNGEEKSEKSNSNYAIYGFIIFCILIAVLFMLKIRRRKFSEFI